MQAGACGNLVSRHWSRQPPTGADGALRSSSDGGSRGVTHNVGSLAAHPNDGPIDPPQQPLHYQLYVGRGGALWGNRGLRPLLTQLHFSSGNFGWM